MLQKSWVLWVLAVMFAIFAMFWQKVSGPTYPVRITEIIGESEFNTKLLRSYETTDDLPVNITIADNNISGLVKWRRLGAGDDWAYLEMVRNAEILTSSLPKQKSAGKVEYSVILQNGDGKLVLDNQGLPIIARFKDPVPSQILIPHIIFMIFGLIWAMRTGIGALASSEFQVSKITTTLIMLGLGGLILGPIVQKFAFGAYWTGWPLGSDWTDNKLAAMVLAWIITLILTIKKQGLARIFTIISLMVTLTVYLIPHSMGGSTLDYSTGETETGMQK